MVYCDHLIAREIILVSKKIPVKVFCMKNDIGQRLREERERLGLSQVAMSDIGGVKKLTQLRYEKGDSFPDAAYLAALSRFGLDVQYVVLGIHSPETYNDDEQELITRFRAASLDDWGFKRCDQ